MTEVDVGTVAIVTRILQSLVVMELYGQLGMPFLALPSLALEVRL